jgi:CIC family chloride channel protein
VPALQYLHPAELPFYALLGLACVPAAVVYVKVFYWFRDAFRRLKIPNHVKPAIGGLLVGAMGFFFPNVLGMGYGWVQRALADDLPLRIAVGLLILKVIATGLTIGSGGSGGVFAPSVVLGGLLGAVLGNAFHALAPSIVPLPAAFILVGMAAFFAGAAKVPVSSLVMLSEMTTGYGLLVPLMLANAISFLLTPRGVSIYEQQVNSRAESGAHAGEFFFDVLERLRVGDVIGQNGSPVAFRRDTPLSEMLESVGSGLQPIYPVINSDGTIYGIIDLGEMRALLAAPYPAPGIVVAEDLCGPGCRVLHAGDSLATALRKLRGTLVEALPVLSSNGAEPLVGVLSRRDISNAYHDYLYRTSDSRTGDIATRN